MSEPDGQHRRRKKATNRMSPEVKVEARFPGALRADLNQRLAGLGRDELKQVLRRTAAAASAEEAKTSRAAAPPLGLRARWARQCRCWVRLGSRATQSRLPLFSQQRKFVEASGASALPRSTDTELMMRKANSVIV